MSGQRAGARGWALGVIGVGAAAAFLAGLAVDAPLLRLVAKPIPILCLAAGVMAEGRGPAARPVWIGLLLSALGDVLLEAGPGLFLAGLVAFLGAHLAYTAGFLRQTRRACVVRALPFAAWGALGYLAMRGGLGALRVPVIVYLAAICVMMWRAAATVGGEGPARTHERLALGGAVLFAISDTVIGLDRFRAPIDGVRVPIILLYWLGQLGIAASVTRRGESGTRWFYSRH